MENRQNLFNFYSFQIAPTFSSFFIMLKGLLEFKNIVFKSFFQIINQNLRQLKPINVEQSKYFGFLYNKLESYYIKPQQKYKHFVSNKIGTRQIIQNIIINYLWRGIQLLEIARRFFSRLLFDSLNCNRKMNYQSIYIDKRLHLAYSSQSEVSQHLQTLTDCFPINRLEELSIIASNLSQMPNMVFSAYHLKFLNLSANHIHQLPNRFSKFPHLQKFDISVNKFTQFPKQILRLKNLWHFNISHNQLESIQGLSRLKQLKQVNFSDNLLKQITQLSQLSQLQCLVANINQIREFPRSMKNLRKLQILELRHNKLTQFPVAITKLKNQQLISLAHNQITRVPDSISGLEKLVMLDLDNNLFKKLPEVFHQMTQLLKLHFNNRLSELPEKIPVCLQFINVFNESDSQNEQ